MAIDPAKDPHARIVTTPLPSQKKAMQNRAKAKPADPFLRAENEDDDGYDPYSDRPPAPESPEADPWK